MNVDSGRRIEIAVDGYSGTAGFVERDDKAILSFQSPVLRLRPGATIEADGRQWIVEKVGSSEFVRGFKVVELRPEVV